MADAETSSDDDSDDAEEPVAITLHRVPVQATGSRVPDVPDVPAQAVVVPVPATQNSIERTSTTSEGYRTRSGRRVRFADRFQTSCS